GGAARVRELPGDHERRRARQGADRAVQLVGVAEGTAAVAAVAEVPGDGHRRRRRGTAAVEGAEVARDAEPVAPAAHRIEDLLGGALLHASDSITALTARTTSSTSRSSSSG